MSVSEAVPKSPAILRWMARGFSLSSGVSLPQTKRAGVEAQARVRKRRRWIMLGGGQSVGYPMGEVDVSSSRRGAEGGERRCDEARDVCF